MKIELELEDDEAKELLEHFKNHLNFDHCWCEFDKDLALKLIKYIEDSLVK